MKVNEISAIISKVVLNLQLTEKEYIIFKNWIRESKNKQLYEKIANGESVKKIMELEEDGFGDDMAYRFSQSLRRQKLKFKAKLFVRYSVSAAILTLLLLATYNIFKNDDSRNVIKNNITANISPEISEQKVILITPKGERIDLEENSLEKILKKEIQENLISDNQEKAVNNVVLVPPRKEFNLILPDGTKVWLNSGSRLSFPSVFSDSIRIVELEGEGYFDVIKNEKKQFLVKSKFFNTNVLGTKFMITSYEDNTRFELSLIEGSVDVKFINNENCKIKQGEGISYNSSNGLIRVCEVDESKVLAKMRGYFVFNEMSLGDITNTLKRWYDMEFVFEDDEMKDIRYFIETRKYENIEDIMLLLKNTKKINYTILDRVVTIKKRL